MFSRAWSKMICPGSAPANVLERSTVDVSFLAGMLVDKFRCHLPLHRQRQRLVDCGIRVGRRSLTNWAGRAIDLLVPVADAQSAPWSTTMEE